MHRLPPLSSLGDVLQAAIRIDHAVGGAIRVVDDARRDLRDLERRGIPGADSMPASRAACEQAAVERRRVVIRDVLTDPAFSGQASTTNLCGFRAVQSMPLIDDRRHLRGVLATFFPTPHHPGPDSIEALNRCCRVAVLLLHCHALHEEAAAADRNLGIRTPELPPAAAHAADTARRLLPGMNGRNDPAVLGVVALNLEVVVREVEGRLQQTAGRGIKSGAGDGNRTHVISLGS